MHRVHASGGLEADLYARLVVVFLDGLAHDVGGLRRGGRGEFSGGSLDVVCPGVHGQQGGFFDVRGSLQTARLENDFHLALATDGLQFGDFVAQRLVVAAEELAD